MLSTRSCLHEKNVKNLSEKNAKNYAIIVRMFTHCTTDSLSSSVDKTMLSMIRFLCTDRRPLRAFHVKCVRNCCANEEVKGEEHSDKGEKDERSWRGR